MGYLYVVKAENMSMYKIGISGVSDARIKTLQAGSPVKLSLLESVYFENSKKVESRLHEIFARKRAHNEWFDLESEDVALLLLYLDNPSKGEKELLHREIIRLTGAGASINQIVRRLYGVTGGRTYAKATKEVTQVMQRLVLDNMQDTAGDDEGGVLHRRILDMIASGKSTSEIVMELHGVKGGRKFSEGAAEVNKVMQYLAMQTIGGNNG